MRLTIEIRDNHFGEGLTTTIGYTDVGVGEEQFGIKKTFSMTEIMSSENIPMFDLLTKIAIKELEMFLIDKQYLSINGHIIGLTKLKEKHNGK